MMQRGMSRILIAFTLTVVLLSTAAPLAAQPLGSAPGVSWRLSWDAVWTWARQGLGLAAGNAHQKSGRDGGCGIDPNCGTCKAGLGVDPNGLRSTDSDGGASIDPNG